MDPSGLKPLSDADAESLGFPTLSPQTMVWSYSWDTYVYTGLRRFHAAKGFNPDSQDVARHLGYPLYQPVRKEDPTSAYIDSLPEGSETVPILVTKAPADDTEAVNTAPTLISRLVSGVSAILEPKENTFGSVV
ncbi:hypothetical protein C8R46DRAFT_49432 [Mycena filopes]|nr:hypothetical protein C8R46DRAFT_49432 [Mycena filopes]